MFKLKTVNYSNFDKSVLKKVAPRIRKNAKIYLTSMNVLYSAVQKGLITWKEYHSYTDVYIFKTFLDVDHVKKIGVVKTSSLTK